MNTHFDISAPNRRQKIYQNQNNRINNRTRAIIQNVLNSAYSRIGQIVYMTFLIRNMSKLNYIIKHVSKAVKINPHVQLQTQKVYISCLFVFKVFFCCLCWFNMNFSSY
jgi:hypothetical protein